MSLRKCNVEKPAAQGAPKVETIKSKLRSRVVEFKDLDAEAREIPCIICMGDFVDIQNPEDGKKVDKIVQLECSKKHLFHYQCIK